MQTIVIGHRNPDMDSICAAIGYADLKRRLGMADVVAARCGETNERIDFVLDRFGFEAPLLLNDVSPRVVDVMQSRVHSVREDSPVYDAIQLIDARQLRGLPVTDAEGRCLGLLSGSKLGCYLFPPREEATTARIVTASLADLVTVIGGALVTGSLPSEAVELFLMVGAMKTESLVPRLEHFAGKKIVLIVADRTPVQRLAIAARVHAIVVTGGATIDEETRAEARAAGVTMIASPHDSATTVLLARGAAQCGRMTEPQFTHFPPETTLDDARRVAADSAGHLFPVLDAERRLVGILSKSDFLKAPARQLILVDHNELAQAVRGADRIPIIEVLDHHKLGGFASQAPVFFWNNPVGSTSTLVALSHRHAGLRPEPRIAGLLAAGIIADTLHLTSPTTTAVDREILAELGALAGIDPAALAEQIFSVGSPLLTMPPDAAITADRKEYAEDGRRFTVAQIEELTFAHFPERKDALLDALARHRAAEGLFFAALLVTDITTQTSLLLVAGDERLVAQIDHPQREPRVWELAGVVSRKKQLLPYLLGCLAKAGS